MISFPRGGVLSSAPSDGGVLRVRFIWVCMGLSACDNMCTFMHFFIHTYQSVYGYTHTYIYTCMQVCKYVYVCKFVKSCEIYGVNSRLKTGVPIPLCLLQEFEDTLDILSCRSLSAKERVQSGSGVPIHFCLLQDGDRMVKIHWIS